MPKFREGDEVFLVQHETDSEANLKVGATGVITEILDTPYEDGNQIKVEWSTFDICPEWWVHPAAIELININLENK